jgi:hypothetical protein
MEKKIYQYIILEEQLLYSKHRCESHTCDQLSLQGLYCTYTSIVVERKCKGNLTDTIDFECTLLNYQL